MEIQTYQAHEALAFIGNDLWFYCRRWNYLQNYKSLNNDNHFNNRRHGAFCTFLFINKIL